MGLEFGRLPDEMEEMLTAAGFWELSAFFKIQREEEKAATDRARREAESNSKGRR